MKHEEYVELVKSYALSIGKKLVVDYLTSKIPWLLSPIVSPILSFAVEKILVVFIYKVETAIFFKYTDIRTTRQGNDLLEAMERNIEAINRGNKDEIMETENKLIDSFRTCFRLNL